MKVTVWECCGRPMAKAEAGPVNVWRCTAPPQQRHLLIEDRATGKVTRDEELAWERFAPEPPQVTLTVNPALSVLSPVARRMGGLK